MNITNTMCRLSELSQWEIDSLVDNMPPSVYLERGWYPEKALGFDKKGNSGFWNELLDSKIVTYTEMMQLLGKTMQFTKSDLKTGMFVKQRNGNFKVVLGDAICGDNNNYGRLDEYKEDLINICKNTMHDVMAVYRPNKGASLTSYLKGNTLTLIWERTEQTPAQKEMEELLLNIEKGEKAMSVMKEQAKLLQSKL
jgi:hypothetical protein